MQVAIEYLSRGVKKKKKKKKKKKREEKKRKGKARRALYRISLRMRKKLVSLAI